MTDISTEPRRGRQPAIRFDPRRARGEEDFARARKHSRLVRSLRILLPAIAIVAVVGFLYAARSAIFGVDFLFSLKGLDLNTKSLTIDHPHVAGFKGTDQAYEVQAKNAVQDLSNPKVVTLHEIDANFGLGEDGTAKVIAKTGVYDGGKDSLHLSDGITVTTSTGYVVTLMDAAVDLHSGTLETDNPVHITGRFGSARGNHLAVTDRGKRIVLDKGVSVTYTESPAADGTNAAPGGGTEAAAPQAGAGEP
jgi:lipopolysaccharide export system protein LptC